MGRAGTTVGLDCLLGGEGEAGTELAECCGMDAARLGWVGGAQWLPSPRPR